ncbi:hypothetical protein E2P81_ATG03429 [Venturia nashicola]|nr:hypothetical protein E2P81_ATG03429 [Venturia nashicola]
MDQEYGGRRTEAKDVSTATGTATAQCDDGGNARKGKKEEIQLDLAAETWQQRLGSRDLAAETWQQRLGSSDLAAETCTTEQYNGIWVLAAHWLDSGSGCTLAGLWFWLHTAHWASASWRYLRQLAEQRTTPFTYSMHLTCLCKSQATSAQVGQAEDSETPIKIPISASIYNGFPRTSIRASLLMKQLLPVGYVMLSRDET